MNASALANNERLDNTDVVLYYRASVRDSTEKDGLLPDGEFAPQDSMTRWYANALGQHYK